jgi:hypothetical protein
MSPARLVRVIRGLRTREEFTIKRLLATKRLYSKAPRAWAGRRFVRPRPR